MRHIRSFLFRASMAQMMIATLILIGAAVAMQLNGWFDSNRGVVEGIAAAAAIQPPRSYTQLTNQVRTINGADVGFVAIVDIKGKPLAMSVQDGDLWKMWQNATADAGDTNVTPLTRYWPMPSTIYRVKLPGYVDRYLVMGMVDMPLLTALAMGGAALLASAVIVLIVGSLRARRGEFGRWRDGFQQMHRAMQSFVAGVDPKPLDIGQSDEMGYLMAAFNQMTGKLIARRLALVQANEQLERRVEHRTQELREAMGRLDDMASRDALTGLANRRALFGKLEEIFNLPASSGTDIKCIMFDLDGFKTVNDTLGHKTGDELLKIAADSMTAHCREEDIPARLGGDEFVLILHVNDTVKAVEIADRIRSAFEKKAAALLSDHHLPISPSMSCGVASRIGCNVTSPEDLIVCADRAMYGAKRSGKRRTEVFCPTFGGASSVATQK